jgi:hypothetical protein
MQALATNYTAASSCGWLHPSPEIWASVGAAGQDGVGRNPEAAA